MEKVDCIIIGAGVVGLAIGEAVGNNREEVIILERHKDFGRETSSRNSEVIHAGIYYPEKSLKTRLCVEGRNLLYEFCEKNNVPFKKIGKLIICVKEGDEEFLDRLFKQAKTNGVDDIRFLSAAEITSLEPHISTPAALYSPSTGIIDSHILMKTLESLCEKKGVTCAYGCEVKGISHSGQDFSVEITDSDGKTERLSTRSVINAAGLESDTIARMVGIDIDKEKYRLRFSKGEYFKINGQPRGIINHLVYPPPEERYLGIHTVLDLQGGLKLGPNAFTVESINYDVNESHADDFFKAVQPYLPFIKPGDLSGDMSGIRSQLKDTGGKFADFIITDESGKGLPGLINLIGIESPGLTSCLSIARYVENIYRGLK